VLISGQIVALAVSGLLVLTELGPARVGAAGGVALRRATCDSWRTAL
jgi:hypothetical protein